MSAPALSAQTQPWAVALQRIKALCLAASGFPAGVEVILGHDEQEITAMISKMTEAIEPGLCVLVSAVRGSNTKPASRERCHWANVYQVEVVANPMLATAPTGAFDLVQILADALQGAQVTSGANTVFFEVTQWQRDRMADEIIYSFQLTTTQWGS